MTTFHTDFLIAGSGAGGMVAALKAHELGLKVLLVEKAGYYGGSTAMSGGGIWVPNNYVLKQHGIENTEDEVVEYLKAVTEGKVPETKLRNYARKGPEMFEFLRSASKEMKFIWSEGYSDYHPEFPFGRKEGRSVEAEPFDLKKLGEDRKFLQPADIEIPMKMWLTAKDFHDMSMVMRSVKGFQAATKIGLRTIANWFKGGDIVALGQSLIGRLRFVLKEKNIPLWLNSPIEQLIFENGKVSGAIVSKNGEKIKVIAAKAILLATGGFDHNKKMRHEFLPEEAQEDFSAGSPNNTGDGIFLGKNINAKLDLMDDAWWMPSVNLPNGKMFTLVSERAIPRSIIVGENGRRFTNEFSPYVNFVHDQIRAGEKTVWQILDQTAINRYMYAGKPPLLPFPKDWYDAGIVFKAKTIEELAQKIKVDVSNLSEEIAEFNRFAKSGKDLKFGRGDSDYDKYYGDPSLKNPVLDEISNASFYAVKIVIGDLGTKGGLVTDELARVLDVDGSIIPGLYAAGNVSASVMGNDYAGAGATIGPSMVFGYIAAENAINNE